MRCSRMSARTGRASGASTTKSSRNGADGRREWPRQRPSCTLTATERRKNCRASKLAEALALGVAGSKVGPRCPHHADMKIKYNRQLNGAMRISTPYQTLDLHHDTRPKL